MKKRILALIAAVLLTVNITPVFGASVYKDSADSKVVKFLSAFDILNIDENTGKFWDDSYVERREMAMILCRLFKYELITEAIPVFTDVSKDDRGYVETAVRHGHMRGYGNGCFGPKDYITGAQLVKIFVEIMNGGNFAKTMGGYPDGYIEVANMLGILNKTSLNFNEPVKRIDVANIIYNSMNSDVFTFAGSTATGVKYEVIEDNTFLTEKLDIYKAEGIVTANEKTSIYEDAECQKDSITIGEYTYEYNKPSNDLLGAMVTAYVHKPYKDSVGTVVYIEESNKNNFITIDADEYEKTEGFDISYYKNDKIKTAQLSDSVGLIYNGRYTDYDPKLFEFESGYIKLTDNDNDKIFDIINVTSYENFVVEKVIDGEKIIFKHGKAPFETEGKDIEVLIDGMEALVSDLKQGYVLSVVKSKQDDKKAYVKIEASTNKIMGSISETLVIDEKPYVKIENNLYKVSDYYTNLVNNRLANSLSAGFVGNFYLDVFGNIVNSNADSPELKVGYLIEGRIDIEAVIPTMTVSIYTTDGKIESFEAKEKVLIDNERKYIMDFAEDKMFINKLNTPALIEYKASGNVLRGIDFASDGFNVDEFSKDAFGRLQCTTKNIISHKYNVSENTKVFRVPSIAKTASNYDEIMNDLKLYSISTGSYFNGGSWYDDLTVYDLNEMGEVKYAVLKTNPLSSGVWEYHPLLVVKSVNNTVTEDGEATKRIRGFAENGKEVEFDLLDDSVAKGVEKGDVIQYRVNDENILCELRIRHKNNETEYYAPKAIDAVYTDPTVYGTFGQVMYADYSMLMLGTDINGILPVDCDLLVKNGSGTVFVYTKDNGKIDIADFSDMVQGDKAFVCHNRSAGTRLVIVYR